MCVCIILIRLIRSLDHIKEGLDTAVPAPLVTRLMLFPKDVINQYAHIGNINLTVAVKVSINVV